METELKSSINICIVSKGSFLMLLVKFNLLDLPTDLYLPAWSPSPQLPKEDTLNGLCVFIILLYFDL